MKYYYNCLITITGSLCYLLFCFDAWHLYTTKYINTLRSHYFVIRVARFWTRLSNWCTFRLANRLAGIFAPTTELDLNRFQPLPFGELVWHLSTQVNNGLLSTYINVFKPRRDKRRCFIPCLVYALVYLSISSNLFNLATLSPRFDSVCMHTHSLFSRKPLLRWHKMVETGLLIKWWLALNSFGS